MPKLPRPLDVSDDTIIVSRRFFPGRWVAKSNVTTMCPYLFSPSRDKARTSQLSLIIPVSFVSGMLHTLVQSGFEAQMHPNEGKSG